MMSLELFYQNSECFRNFSGFLFVYLSLADPFPTECSNPGFSDAVILSQSGFKPEKFCAALRPRLHHLSASAEHRNFSTRNDSDFGQSPTYIRPLIAVNINPLRLDSDFDE